MTLTDGLIQQFLDLLGVQINTATGNYVAFLAGAALLCVAVVSFMVLLFKFLCYIRRG